MNSATFKMRIRLIAFLLTLAVGLGVVGSAIKVQPAVAYDERVQIMPFSRLPQNLAGYLTYVQYRKDLSVAAYKCARGSFLPGILSPTIRSCVDMRMMREAHSVRGRQFHMVDYFMINRLERHLLTIWSNQLTYWTAVAKRMVWFGEKAYWLAAVALCAKASIIVGGTATPVTGAVAGAACGKAFDTLNPFKNL